jgi:ribosomal protein S17E
MGKSMSNKIKSKARIIIKEFRKELSIEFRKNKEFLKKLSLPFSKLTVNLMAGYITRVLKADKKEKESLKIDTEKIKTVPIREIKSDRNIIKS